MGEEESQNPNRNPKFQIARALARAKQSSVLLSTFMQSFFANDNFLLHLYEAEHRLLYVDLYLLFDKDKSHLNLKRIINDNKHSLKDSDFNELINNFEAIENKYKKLISNVNYVGNAIIRHIDSKKISIIYGADFGKYALDMQKVENMIDDIVRLLKESHIFSNKMFQDFDYIVGQDQIVAICNLEVQKPIKPLPNK